MIILLFGILVLTRQSTAGQETDYNYVEALQKSLYFYDAEKSGPGIAGGRLEWRGDSEVEDQWIALSPDSTNLSQEFIDTYQDILDPDGDGTVDLSGGYHDAGDHVKFGLPQSYSASTLGWSYYEFKDAFVENGQDEHMLDILKWFSDYLLRSTFIDTNGDVIAFNYMVGEGSVDHNYWGPPELQDVEKYPRPATFATDDNPAADQAAGAAAALALMSLNYQDVDAAYAQECLDAAIGLYEFAQKYPGTTGNSDGFYNSSYPEDEMAWAAVWLYVATEDMTYIEDITAVSSSGQYTGYMSKIIATTSNTWQNIWVHSWDTVWGGVFMKLANLFPEDEQFDYFARWNLEYWTGGTIPHEDSADVSYAQTSPAGFTVINTWGSARYNSAAQFQALVYAKYTGRMDFVEDWGQGQMDYIMGSNPFGYSLIVGFGDAYCSYPHHRAAHGSKTNSMLDPEKHKHTLWGALCGGPDTDDNHKDVTTDYVYNEVAIDYNAGFVGALAGYVYYFGQDQEPLANFPPLEPEVDEYYVEARLEQESSERTQVTLSLHNESVHPPHYESGMSTRYFFDISEMVAAGQTIDDISVAIYYDEQQTLHGTSTDVSGPNLWDADNHIYYLEFDWSGNNIYGDREIQFALIAAQDSNWTSHWDSTNDWSRQGMVDEYTISQYVPVYLDGVLTFGSEPEIGTIPTNTATATATQTATPVTPEPTDTPTATPVTPGPTDTPTATPVTPEPTDTPTATPVTPEPTDTPIPTETSTPTGNVCTVDYTVANQWQSGFVANIVITNVSASPVQGYTLTWDFSDGQTFSSGWNANYSQSGTTVSASNDATSWNGMLSANGGSASFGFQGTHTGSNTVPSTFTLNGTVCNE